MSRVVNGRRVCDHDKAVVTQPRPDYGEGWQHDVVVDCVPCSQQSQPLPYKPGKG